MNPCNFGVPVEGGEFKVFLLFHLEHSPKSSVPKFESFKFEFLLHKLQLCAFKNVT